MLERFLRRLLHPATRRVETTVHPLRCLYLELTRRCDLRCLHCEGDCAALPADNELSTKEWLQVFAYLREERTGERARVVVTGGEPLCHPELDALLDGLRLSRLRWSLISNGQALGEDRLARLLDAGLDELTISLDGMRESHDWLRGVPGAFQRATRAIELAVRRLPSVEVASCVSPRNLEELPTMLALVRELGVHRWVLSTIFPRGRAAGRSDLALGSPELRRLLAFIAEQRQVLDHDELEVGLGCESYLPPGLDQQVRDEPYFCRAGITVASVLCDGSIAGCPAAPRNLSQGNIRRDDLLSVWDERFTLFRQRDWMRRRACERCSHWSRCQGNSLHLWDEPGGHTSCCSYELAGGRR